MRRAVLLALSAATLLHAALPARAQYLGLEPAQGAAHLREEAGRSFSFVCPASDGSAGKVYGTDTYTADSAVCAAAIHAGALPVRQAGVVTILIGGAARSFEGTRRNGVTTHSYGAWPYSYTFVRGGSPGDISWTTVWNGIPTDFQQPIVVNCPERGASDKSIWGTGVYTRDSAICVAAVHAGVIAAEKGGLVTVQRSPGQKEFPGSERNQVVSKRWGPYEDAFTVAAASAEPPPPPAPPPSSGGGVAPRTITVAGFTGVGSASRAGPIGPRTIGIAGFSGVGSAPTGTDIEPRTIQTPGWTGVGSAP